MKDHPTFNEIEKKIKTILLLFGGIMIQTVIGQSGLAAFHYQYNLTYIICQMSINFHIYKYHKN